MVLLEYSIHMPTSDHNKQGLECNHHHHALVITLSTEPSEALICCTWIHSYVLLGMIILSSFVGQYAFYRNCAVGGTV